MPIEIKSTRGYSVDAVKMCLYGPAGVGKTRACATAPKPIIVSAERGLLSLANMDIPYVEVNTLDDIDRAFNLLKKDKTYSTICLDSASEIAETVLTKLKPGQKDARQAYMKMADAVSVMFRNFRDLEGKHIVMTAKLRSREDEETGAVTDCFPSLPGKVLPESMPYVVDEVFAMRMKFKGSKIERYIQTNPDRIYLCKDRSDALDKIEPPDLGAIFDKIMAHCGKTN